MYNKVVKDGKVAVLVSPDLGSGWFTANSEYPELLFHERLIEAAEQGVKDIEPVIHLMFGEDNDICTLGWKNVEVKWVKEGTRFYIEEYDGSETLLLIEDIAITA